MTISTCAGVTTPPSGVHHHLLHRARHRRGELGEAAALLGLHSLLNELLPLESAMQNSTYRQSD